MTLSTFLIKAHNALNVFENVKTVATLAGSLMGKDPGEPKADEPAATKAARGLYGMMGYADERLYIEQVATETDAATQASVAEFSAQLFAWETIDEWVATYYWGNKYRVFVTKMNPPGRKVIFDAIHRVYGGLGTPDEKFERTRQHLSSLGVPVPPKEAGEKVKQARLALPGLWANAQRVMNAGLDKAVVKVDAGTAWLKARRPKILGLF